MHITCEFSHDQYGILTLSGQYHEAEPEVGLLYASAVLESVLTSNGEELLAYANGNQVGVPAGDFNEMQEYLQYNGEPCTRLKPIMPSQVSFSPRRHKDLAIDIYNEALERKEFEPWTGKNEPTFETLPPNPYKV